jgi:glycosyl transferase family 25
MAPRPLSTQVIVISMEGSLERRQRFAARAQNTPIAWEFFPAYTSLHPALSYDEKDSLVTKGRTLSQGELGCYSSHYAAWESLLASPYDQIVVLEDDVIADWELVAKLAAFDLTQLKVGYLRLSYNVPVKATVVKRRFINYNRRIVELFGFASGTQGYVIAKPAAKVLLEYCRRVRRPIDDQIDSSWRHGIRNLSVFPFSVTEESTDSAIGVDRFKLHKMPAGLHLQHILDKQRTQFTIRAMRAAHRIQRVLGRTEL